MNKTCKGFILIKEYPGSKDLGFFEPFTTGDFLKYPEIWQPVYEDGMEFKDLVGKTIMAATPKKLKNCDDEGFLELKFSDGTKAIIVAFYGGHTGKSEDEYPTYIDIVRNYNKELVDIKK